MLRCTLTGSNIISCVFCGITSYYPCEQQTLVPRDSHIGLSRYRVVFSGRRSFSFTTPKKRHCMATILEPIKWTQEEYNQRVLQMKAMGLSPESIAYITAEIIIVNPKPKKDDKQD